MDAETLHRWQERQLIYQVNYVYESSPFYKWFYQRHRVDIGKVTSMEQFQQRIPIVRKDDLREYQELTGDPYAGLCCVPREQLVHTWVSSGTTGMPTLGGYTREDMAIAIEVYARNAYGSGLYRPGMRMLCSTAAWHWISPLYWGMTRRLGLRPVVASFQHPNRLERLIWLMERFQPEMLISVSSELTTLIPHKLMEMNLNPQNVLKYIQLVVPNGEPLTPERKRLIKTYWGEHVQIQETAGSGAGESFAWARTTLCPEHDGGHLWGDIIFPEIVDPDTGRVLPNGEWGEFVSTHLVTWGMPYIRFGTEDISRLLDVACPRLAHPVADTIIGRTGWRAKVNGNTIVPFDVEVILQRHKETEKAQFCIRNYLNQRSLHLDVVYDEHRTADPEELRQRLIRELREAFGVDVKLRWVREEDIPRHVHHKLIKFVHTKQDESEADISERS